MRIGGLWDSSLKTPMLMIMGHTDCEAIKSFNEGYKSDPDSVKPELNDLIPALHDEEKPLLMHIEDNLDCQVRIAMEKYDDLIHSNKLLIICAIYDFRNDYNGGYGNLIIHSLNGVKND